MYAGHIGQSFLKITIKSPTIIARNTKAFILLEILQTVNAFLCIFRVGSGLIIQLTPLQTKDTLIIQ